MSNGDDTGGESWEGDRGRWHDREDDLVVTLAEDHRLVELVLNRPSRLNAQTAVGLRRLRSVVEDVSARPDVGVIVVRGTGRAFCAGGDLGSETSPDGALALNDACRALRDAPVPVVAAVHGAAVGAGAALALACDVVVMAEGAFFSFPFGELGLMPEGGLSATLATRLGTARATRVLLTGERVQAARAEAWGLVSEVVSQERLASRTRELAVSISTRSRRANELTKRALHEVTDVSFAAALRAEAAGQAELLGSREFADAVARFRERAAHRDATSR